VTIAGLDETTSALLSLVFTLIMTAAWLRWKYGPLEPRMRAWTEARFGPGAWKGFYAAAVVLTVVGWGAVFFLTDPAERGGTDQVIEKFQGGGGGEGGGEDGGGVGGD
jgi:hypothetical protein